MPVDVVKQSSMFRLSYAVAIGIEAPPERVWALLTNAEDFPRWNSTVVEVKGPIALGTKLALKVKLSDRTFTPSVTAFEAPTRMVWSDGMAPMFRGVRTFTLTKVGTGTTFAMEEVFAGIMLPMIRGSLPDFTGAFATYAEDLKREAERS